MADEPRAHVERGLWKRNVSGTAVFVGSRGLEPLIQYGILGRGWGSNLITALGGRVLPIGPPALTHYALVDQWQLSPYRTILFSMSIAAASKQIFHSLFIQNEGMSPAFSGSIGLLNAGLNSMNSLLFVCAQTSASVNGEHYPQTPLIVGTTLFAVGLLTEWFSEIQRAAWKREPKNKGRIYQDGLFGLSRHINYLGYQLWRTGFAIASGGWLWGATIGGLSAYGFVCHSIPELQSYMQKRYGVQFEEYARHVPYKFVPFLW